jgi:hypothetical protein
MEVIKLKKRKLFTSFALSCAVLLSFSSSVSAVSTDVTLAKTQTSNVSGTIGLSSDATYMAANDGTSSHSVYAIVNKVAPGKSWVVAGESLMGAGAIAGSSFVDNNASWKLELNPYGWSTSGCLATGSLWY